MASDGEVSCTNDPNFAVIYSFLKVFGNLYGLEVPSIIKLQELIENTQEVLEPLKDLHLRLLRRSLKSVQSNKWEKALIKLCHQQGYHQEAWEIERFSYKKASTTIKLKVLKFLLEYQFSCHSKFKSAVNGLPSKDLRLDPIGRDKLGCVYWLQVDDDANLCLYKEDQDEETWQLIARNREELVRVIDQLKRGEEIFPSATVHEDSIEDNLQDSTEKNSKPAKSDLEEENEDEFLSPESESEHDSDDTKEKDTQEIKTNSDILEDTDNSIKENVNSSEVVINNEEDKLNEEHTQKESETLNDGTTDIEIQDKLDSEISNENKEDDSNEDVINDDNVMKSQSEMMRKDREEKIKKLQENEGQNVILKENSEIQVSEESSIKESPREKSPENIKEISGNTVEADSQQETESQCKTEPLTQENDNTTEHEKLNDHEHEEEDELYSDAIEEPVMIIKGEGNGADCESFFIGEEICEPVMYIYGDGYGYENDTGNPKAIDKDQDKSEDAEEECNNGEVNDELAAVTTKTRSGKCISLKTPLPAVNKRVLKKQSNDNTDELKTDPKKHCIRDSSSSSNMKQSKSPEIESPCKNNIKKGRTKAKKHIDTRRNDDNSSDSKTNIIEKRKGSISSVEQDDNDHTDTEKEKSLEKETKVDDSLPLKKLRLETSPESDAPLSHSNENVNNLDDVINEDDKEIVKNGNDNVISTRKKIKAKKGKNRKIKKQNKDETKIDTSNDVKCDGIEENSNKKGNKSLKRTILDATMSDKNKSESQTESDDSEPMTSGKRLKIKPKKIVTTSRKKVEAKLQENKSSDESEEETLYSLAGKSAKKNGKKKPRIKEKLKGDKSQSEESDIAPVRQSRRIAQMKIKEEADRRHLEDLALRELKKIHKKKSNDDEEEDWKASGHSSSEAEAVVKSRRVRKWRGSDSTGPEPDSESDEPLFEHHHESELDFTKSDHEFSPESDLENGDETEPAKRARTLQEGKDEGFCKRCGSGEQPEWILLCDRCDEGYHASCLKPMLFLIPEGDWFCPPCGHTKLIASLEEELVKYDELASKVKAKMAQKVKDQPQPQEVKEEKGEMEDNESSKSGTSEDVETGSGSDWSSSDSEEGAVYRLRARKQLSVSYRSQEYDRLISSAIKEEYVEPATAAGNQGRGKDISTIIEAAEEEKLKAERDAQEQGKPVEKRKKKQRRKPRKLNSLDVPSEDDGETDEDFKDTGMESSSESISSSAEKDSPGSSSSDDLPIRRIARVDKKERTNLDESSPEVKKKKKVFESSSENGEDKEKESAKKLKKKQGKKRDKSSKRSHKNRGLTQYDAEGNVIRARVTYGGLSGEEDENDWSPKHRTRQKKINYTEMPNTESEDEMHKSGGKHMDSSDEFKISSDDDSDSECERARKKQREAELDEEKQKAISDLIKKTAVVPLEKLPDNVTKEKIEELHAHLSAQAEVSSRPLRGKGSRGGRGSRGSRGRGRVVASTSTAEPDDELAKLVGVKIKDLSQPAITPLQAERDRKRQEREAKLAEKQAKKVERIQKKEEKERMKEQKAKEREEKRLARIALQENKRYKKDPQMSGFPPIPVRPMAPDMQMFSNMNPQVRMPADYHEHRFPPAAPRLQVRAELRGILKSEDRLSHTPHRPDRPQVMHEGTLSVAGSPQPFKPVSEEPSVITRMPHMINQQYRGPMYSPANSPYGPRGQNMMYPMHHPALNHPQNMAGGRPQYPPQGFYQHMRGLPPGYPTQQGLRPNSSTPPGPHGNQGPHGNMGPHVNMGPHGNMGPHSSLGPHGNQGPHSNQGPHGIPGHGNQGSHGMLAGHIGAAQGSHPQGLNPAMMVRGQHPSSPLVLHHAAPPSPHGPHHGAPPSPHGGHHGAPPSPHGPHHATPPSPHGLHHGAPPSPHGAHPAGPRPPPHMPPPHAGLVPFQGVQNPTAHRPSPALQSILQAHLRPQTPPQQPAPRPQLSPQRQPSPTSPAAALPIKIKAEVKTEPEYRSPPSSPPKEEPPRNHPKIKHTENKDRRARFPLGPYAPQYGPYGPYAPAPAAHNPEAPPPDMSPQYLPPPPLRAPLPPHYGMSPMLQRHAPPTRFAHYHNAHGSQEQPGAVTHSEAKPTSPRLYEAPGPSRSPLALHATRTPLQPISAHVQPRPSTLRPTMPIQSAPPLLQSTPALIQSNPPPIQSTPPPVQSTPPPVQSTPPPVHSIPPPIQSAPPPIQSAPPPVQSAPPPLRPDPVSVHMGPASDEKVHNMSMHEPNGQKVPVIKQELNDNDRAPSPAPRPQQFLSIAEHLNKPPTIDSMKRLQEIKNEYRQEETENSEPPPREEGSVFGGLVSYFSSQQDDIDS